MKLTSRRAASERRGVRLTNAAGWIVIAFGAVHVVVAPLDTRDTWSQVAADGWWNTFTLDKSTTLDQFERSETFWVTLGSFGAPLLVLGCYIVWSTHQRHRVPRWIGWSLLGYGGLIVSTLPASPAWALAVSGTLIVLGDRRRRRTASPRTEREKWALPPKVEYTLTALGRSVREPVAALRCWSEHHINDVARAQARHDARTGVTT